MRLADNELEAFGEVLEQMLGPVTCREPAKCKLGPRDRAGEVVMEDWFKQKGWQVLGHHSVGEHGPDAIAWRKKDGKLQLLLLDNKALDSPAAVSKAPGLYSANVARHLSRFIIPLRNSRRPRPGAEEAARLLEATWLQIVRNPRYQPWSKLPDGVYRVITNGCGKSSGVASSLPSDIRFGDIARCVPGRPPLPPELS
jgi:hypothetical protein